MFGTYTSSRQTVIPEDQKRYNGIIAVKKRKNTHNFYYSWFQMNGLQGPHVQLGVPDTRSQIGLAEAGTWNRLSNCCALPNNWFACHVARIPLDLSVGWMRKEPWSLGEAPPFGTVININMNDWVILYTVLKPHHYLKSANPLWSTKSS